jgi:alanine racemase
MNAASPSELTVDLGAYAANLSCVRDRIPDNCSILAVVKANAYGLGAVPIALRALESGARMLGVATVDEGAELRAAGIKTPILVMVQPLEADLGTAIEHDLRLGLSDVATAERFGELAHKAKVVAGIHCEVDTGMGRQGFALEGAADALLGLTRISNVDIEGVYTHFPIAESPDDPFTLNQIKLFKQLLKRLGKDGVPYEVAHASNSAAVVNFPGSAFDMVRPGLMTFGVWPGEQPPEPNPLRPVVRWTSHVVLLKDLASEESIGYGRSYTTRGPTRTAVVPVGYEDGFPYGLSNVGEVLIRGARCKVLGRVSMDQIVAEVTEVGGVAVGDIVTLIGDNGGENVTVGELAERAGTIPYDVLTGIGSRVARTYVS